MTAREFKDADHETLSEWLIKRDMNTVPKTLLPKFGVIVDDLASIHLLRTDSGLSIMDYFATNPDAPEEERLKACDLCMKACLEEANNRGAEVLIGMTAIYKVMALGLRYGFKADPRPNYFFRKNLKE